MTTDSKARGLYDKYHVTRTDGSSEPGGKHDGCQYFVLDTDHDPFAARALRAYAAACRDVYPALAADLDALVKKRDVWLDGLGRVIPAEPIRCPECGSTEHVASTCDMMG